MRSKLLLALGIAMMVYGLAWAVVNTNTDVELQKLDVRTKQAEINDLNKQIDELENDSKSDDKKLEDIKKENERLQRELQAKRERQAEEAANVAYAASISTKIRSGDWVAQCHKWADMAGISLNSWAIELIDRESNCNPTVWNYEGSGAGGIPQALPASKMGCPMVYTDEAAVCQLKWMLTYVQNRYGSWEQAVYFHNANNWY